jgi:hypothetical protein
MLPQPQTFPCPNCNEIINDTMERCRYCSTPVDRQFATIAAEKQSKINQAYSDANFLRTAAAAIFVFVGLSFVPFISFVAYLGSLFTFLAVAVMLIRWQIKFGSLRTPDPDFEHAKRLRNVTLVFWLFAIPIFLVREAVGAVVVAVLSRLLSQ